ncbi:MAG TPA: flagellar basal body rod protein FlgB [Candidatus Cybelea sp.]|nr:flagellar basal body rod protein FlgB [Candidatus Cybelea sp.]
MDLNKLPVFAALKRQMDWLNERQRVIAENIANADTPGYKPHDLKEPSFSDLLSQQGGGKLVPVATNAMHLGPSGAQSGSFREDVQRRTEETTPTGNAVNLEQEMVKLAEAQVDYTTASSLYKKHLGLIMIALGKK